MNHGKSIAMRVGRASVRWCPACERYTFDRIPNATDSDMADLITAITQLREVVTPLRALAPAGHIGY